MPTPSPKWILHLDMDAFFASVEQRDHPRYRGKPVVVGARPGRRGVVSTCSYEARRYGIHSAMPISEAYRRCPKAIYLRPDMARYQAVSEQLFAALAELSPLVEPVSVDEAYVDISGLERLFGTPEEIGVRTKRIIAEAVHLNCSVGIGPNRLIAKLASEASKPDGLKVVPQQQVQDFLDPLPVNALRGVGRQTQKISDRLGIRTVAQLRGYPLSLLQLNFGDKAGQSLHDQARGIASSRVGDSRERQSISKEHTFNEDLTDPAAIDRVLVQLAAEVGQIARAKGLKGRRVHLKLRLSGFETHTRQRRIPQATNADNQLLRHGRDLYQASGHQGEPLRLLGLGISEWDDAPVMGDLFDSPEENKKEERLFETLDSINEKFQGKLHRGLFKHSGGE